MSRPLQRASASPLEARSCKARRPINHIPRSLPPRGGTEVGWRSSNNGRTRFRLQNFSSTFHQQPQYHTLLVTHVQSGHKFNCCSQVSLVCLRRNQEIDLICDPLSRTTSCNHNVFTASALTFTSPACCAMPRAATESQNRVAFTLNPKCSGIDRKYPAIPLLVATQLCLRENDVSGQPSAST